MNHKKNLKSEQIMNETYAPHVTFSCKTGVASVIYLKCPPNMGGEKKKLACNYNWLWLIAV